MILSLFFLLNIAISAKASAYFDSSRFATKIVDTLIHKNFNCTLTSVESGYRCRGKLPSYPEAVNIFIPVQIQDISILALHFHGFNICGNSECHFNLLTGDGDYGKFLSRKTNSTLLIIPESTGKIATYLNHFQNPESFDTFVLDIQKILGITTFSRLKISSHSGSDKLMERFASWEVSPTNSTSSHFLKKVYAVALFDSFYEYRKSFPMWISKLARENPNFYFLGSYVHNSSTDRQNAFMYMQWLQTALPESSQIQYIDVRTTHFGIMKNGKMSEFLRDTFD